MEDNTIYDIEGSESLTHQTKCNCGHDVDHVVSFSYWPDKKYGGMMCVSTGLNHYLSLWRRIGVAFRYILGIDNTYCTYTETVLDLMEMNNLREYLEKCVDKELEGWDTPTQKS